MQFWRCQNSTDSNLVCKSDDEIDTILGDATLQIYIKYKNVDFTNYKDPIQEVFDDRIFYEFIPSLRYKSDLLIEKNVGEFQDDFL